MEDRPIYRFFGGFVRPWERMPLRLDKLVADRFGLSRRVARDAVLCGRVDVAGAACDEPGLEVEPDVELAYVPHRPKARKVETSLVVLYEDRHLMIVDKPAGILTLPTAAREPGTLLERISKYVHVRSGRRPYVGIAHRLDKDTSGALAVALSPRALREMQAIFRMHEIDREYLVVVSGSVLRAEGTIDLPIVADRGDLRRGVARGEDEGKHAVTHYRVLDRFGDVASLLSCRLETGRTHQIRIHLAAIGHPVIGDKVYRPKNDRPGKARFHRQALHARTLGFEHPFGGGEVYVEANPPADFQELIDRLSRRRSEYDRLARDRRGG